MTQNKMIGKDYLPCSEILSEALLADFVKTNKVSENFEPIFIMIMKEEFKQWIIAIHDIEDCVSEENSLTFSYSVVRVPAEVSNDTVITKQEELNSLTKEIFQDIITIAAERAEADLAE